MYIHFQALNHSIAELDGTVGPRLTQYDGTRRKILLGEIALCDDFGTTLSPTSSQINQVMTIPKIRW